MSSTRRAHTGEVLQPGPGKTGASMKREMLGEVEEQRRSDPRSSPVFYCLFYSLTMLLTRGKGETLLQRVLEFVALTSAIFMQDRNVWARQVKHLLEDIEWDNTDHAHGCQGGTSTSE